MRYYVTLDAGPNARPHVVDLTPLPCGALEVHVDGRKADVNVIPSGRGPAAPLTVRPLLRRLR